MKTVVGPYIPTMTLQIKDGGGRILMEVNGLTKYTAPDRAWFSVEMKVGESTITVDPREIIQAFQNFCP